MKFLDRMRTAARIAISNIAYEDYVRAFLSGKDLDSGEQPHQAKLTPEQALHSTVVLACCRVLAETFASAPVQEYRKDPKTGDRLRTNETGIYHLLHTQPNSDMSAFSFWELAMMQLCTTGNFVALRVHNAGGRLIGLVPLDSERITVSRDAVATPLKYEYRRPGVAQPITMTRDEVVHITGLSLDGVVGVSPLTYAANAIDLGLSHEQYSRKMYRDGLTANVVFEHPGALGDVEFERLKKTIKDEWQGIKSKGTPIILEDGMKASALSIKPVDAQLIESRKFQVEDICRIYRVPQHMIGQLDKATFSNIEHQSLEFVMYSMLPWFRRVEAAINTQLLNPLQQERGYYFEFNMAGLLRGDQKSMAEALAVGRQWGWYNVNEIRRMLNMNGIGPDGDVYLSPLNMNPIGSTTNVDNK